MNKAINLLYAEHAPKVAAETCDYFSEHAPEYELEIVDTSRKLLQRLKKKSYAAVLLDDALPGKGHTALLEKVIDEFNLPVIVLTETEDEHADLIALRLGAADYVARHKGYLQTLPNVITATLKEFKVREEFQSTFKDTVRNLLYIEPDAAEVKRTVSYFKSNHKHYHIDAVSTCAAGLELLEGEHTYDLVLTEFRLPDMNVLELLREVKYRGVHLPFIILTAAGNEEAAVAALKLGASDYILKQDEYLSQLNYCIRNAITRFQLDIINQHLQKQFEQLSTSLDVQVKERTRELQESEERFRLISENAADLIAVLNQEGDILYASPSFFYQLGHIQRELTGKKFTSLLASEEAQKFENSLALLVQGKIPFVEDYHFRNQSNESKLFESAGNLVESPDDDFAKIVIVSRDIEFRKSIESKLSASESQYRKLTELSPVGIFHCDARRFCLLVNERWNQLSGIEDSAAHGEGWLSAIHPDDKLGLMDTWHQAVERDEPFRLEYRFKRPDGKEIWVYGEAASVKDNEGNITGYIETVMNINERKRAESELRDSEERYRQLVELSPEAIVVQYQAKIVYVNKKAISIFGAKVAEDLLGTSAMDYVHPDSLKLVQDRRNRLQTEGARLETVSEKLFRLDGSVMDAEVASAPITFMGKPCIQVVVTDVTDSMQARRQLSRMRFALDAVSECVMMTDPEHEIIYVNSVFLNTYGYTERDIVGSKRSIVEFGGGDPPEIQVDSLTGWENDTTERHYDGHEMPMRVKCKILRGDDDNIAAILYISSPL